MVIPHKTLYRRHIRKSHPLHSLAAFAVKVSCHKKCSSKNLSTFLYCFFFTIYDWDYLICYPMSVFEFLWLAIKATSIMAKQA